MKQTPIYEIYARIAPGPEHLPVLFAKLDEMLRRDYDWSEEASKIRGQRKKDLRQKGRWKGSHLQAFCGREAKSQGTFRAKELTQRGEQVR